MELEDDGFLCRRHPHRLDPAKYRLPGQPILVTICSAGQRPVLVDECVREELIGALDVAADSAGCEVMAWCLMPEHVHVLIQVRTEGGDILRFLHGYKAWTGRVMREAGLGRVWERSFWDRHARSRDDIVAIVSYVMHNPVRRGFCKRPEEWPFADYRRFASTGAAASGEA